ncbi:MAG: hypothetical protein IJR40_09470, partial [Treponema sp.]|nr:hypothetical protein [Treponema sp.]
FSPPTHASDNSGWAFPPRLAGLFFSNFKAASGPCLHAPKASVPIERKFLKIFRANIFIFL